MPWSPIPLPKVGGGDARMWRKQDRTCCSHPLRGQRGRRFVKRVERVPMGEGRQRQPRRVRRRRRGIRGRRGRGSRRCVRVEVHAEPSRPETLSPNLPNQPRNMMQMKWRQENKRRQNELGANKL